VAHFFINQTMKELSLYLSEMYLSQILVSLNTGNMNILFLLTSNAVLHTAP